MNFEFAKSVICYFIVAKSSHTGFVNGLCFTLDGLHIVSFGTDNTLRLWNTTNGRNTLVNYGRVENKTKKCVPFAVSTDSSPGVIYIPNGSNIDVLDLMTGMHIHTLRGHFKRANCCIVHPFYQELYSGGNDRNILMWVPDSETVAYDDYIRDRSETDASVGKVAKHIATADTWSDNE